MDSGLMEAAKISMKKLLWAVVYLGILQLDKWALGTFEGVEVPSGMVVITALIVAMLARVMFAVYIVECLATIPRLYE